MYHNTFDGLFLHLPQTMYEHELVLVILLSLKKMEKQSVDSANIILETKLAIFEIGEDGEKF